MKTCHFIRTKKALGAISLFLVLCLFACNKPLERVEHYASGEIKRKWILRKNEAGQYVKHGEARVWYRNGKPRSSSHYSNGVLEGKWTSWYMNGNMQSEKEFEAGFLVREIHWDTLENITRQGEYIIVEDHNPLREKYTVRIGERGDSTKHGKIFRWFKEGELEFAGEYYDGNLHGFARSWHANGQLKEEGSYLFGQREGAWKTWFDNGRLSSSIRYRKGAKDGQYRLWYETGVLKEKGMYSHDTWLGEITRWHKNKSISEQCTYLSGQNEGLCTRWYPNSKMKSETYWVAGRIQDTVQYWYPDGTLQRKTYYQDGNRQGTDEYWYPDGTPAWKTLYHDDKLHGKLFWWNRKKNLISERKYQNGLCISDTRTDSLRKATSPKGRRLPLGLFSYTWGYTRDQIYMLAGIESRSFVDSSTSHLTMAFIPKEFSLQDTLMLRMNFAPGGQLYSLEVPLSGDHQVSTIQESMEKLTGIPLGLPRFRKEPDPSGKDSLALVELRRDWGTFRYDFKGRTYVKPVLSCELLINTSLEKSSLKLTNHFLEAQNLNSRNISDPDFSGS